MDADLLIRYFDILKCQINFFIDSICYLLFNIQQTIFTQLSIGNPFFISNENHESHHLSEHLQDYYQTLI